MKKLLAFGLVALTASASRRAHLHDGPQGPAGCGWTHDYDGDEIVIRGAIRVPTKCGTKGIANGVLELALAPIEGGENGDGDHGDGVTPIFETVSTTIRGEFSKDGIKEGTVVGDIRGARGELILEGFTLDEDADFDDFWEGLADLFEEYHEAEVERRENEEEGERPERRGRGHPEEEGERGHPEEEHEHHERGHPEEEGERGHPERRGGRPGKGHPEEGERGHPEEEHEHHERGHPEEEGERGQPEEEIPERPPQNQGGNNGQQTPGPINNGQQNQGPVDNGQQTQGGNNGQQTQGPVDNGQQTQGAPMNDGNQNQGPVNNGQQTQGAPINGGNQNQGGIRRKVETDEFLGF